MANRRHQLFRATGLAVERFAAENLLEVSLDLDRTGRQRVDECIIGHGFPMAGHGSAVKPEDR